MKVHHSEDHPVKPFRTFEDLQVYQLAREFRKAMYRVDNMLSKELDESIQPFNDFQ